MGRFSSKLNKPSLRLIHSQNSTTSPDNQNEKPSIKSPLPKNKKVLRAGSAFINKRAVQINATHIETQGPNTIPTEGDILRKRLIAYRRINELYQEKGLELSALMKDLCDLIVQATEAEGGSLWIADREKNEIECVVATGPGSKNIIHVTIPLGKGIVGWVIEKNQSALVEDTDRDDRFSQKGAKQKEFPTHSLIACPLNYRGEVIGALEVINKKTITKSFDDSDRIFLEDICTPTAMHIKNASTLTIQNNILRRLDTMRQLHESFGSTMDLDKLLSLVIAKAIELLDAEVGSLWLIDANQEKIECHTAEGPTKSKVLGMKVDVGAGIIGWVVQNARGSIVEDCSKDSRFSSMIDEKIQFVTRSMVSAPLTVQGECIGAIQIINKKDSQALFTKDDLGFLSLFTSSSAMYIKNARLFASESKAKELSALIALSKEVSSTLDLDSVLYSIVNLSTSIINYDQASISCSRNLKAGYSLQVISGETSINRSDPNTIFLQNLHHKIMASDKDVTVLQFDEKDSKDLMPELTQYMKAKDLKSFWAGILKDDQGPLGLFSMESQEKNLIPDKKKELLTILVSQCTIALRNAELYTTVPKGGLLKGLTQTLMESFLSIKTWPKSKLRNVAALTTTSILALIFIKVPWNISAPIEVLPKTTTFYSHSSGKVDKVLVKEGQNVKEGDLLVKLEIQDLQIQARQKDSTRQKVISEMLKLQSDHKIAEFKIKENERHSLDFEIEMLTQQILKSEIRSTIDGIVISEKLEELPGKPVNFGQELIKVATKDTVYIQYEISEEDIPFVKPDQEVKFKLFGYPNTSFSKNLKVFSVAGEARKLNEKAPDKVFTAKVLVDLKENSNSLLQLRPGMTGRGKIYTDWRPLGLYLLHKPLQILGIYFF